MQDPKIIFLGIAGDSYTAGKQILSSGGIILQMNDMQFHIDPGPGSLIKAKQYDVNIRENTALFISHNHINHSNDANAVISAMTHNGDDKRGVLVANSTVINGNDKETPAITKYHLKCLEKSITLSPGNKIGIGNVDILGTPTKHSDSEGIGFKFFTQSFVLSYVGDTGYSKEVAEAHKGSDIVILNVVNPDEVNNKNQMNTVDAIKFLKVAKPSLAIITHFGVKMLSSDPINEARTIQRETKIQTIAAKDGMILNPKSYDAIIKQRRLNVY